MQTTDEVVDMKVTATRFIDLFDRQKAYFNTNITKSYEWRIDQLDRLSRMLSENMSACGPQKCDAAVKSVRYL